MRSGVEAEIGIPLADQRLHRVRDDLLQGNRDRGVVPFRILMDPGDRAAGQDVVELLQQHQVPKPLDFRRRVFGAAAHRGGGGPELGFAEQVLAAPIALFGVRLRGVGASVQLQIHLAQPHRWGRVVGLGLLEETLRTGHPDRRGSLKVCGAPGCGDHFPGWSAAAVAPAERHQGNVAAPLLPVIALRVRQLAAVQLGVVGVHRREVGEQPGTVDAFPEEGVVRHHVLLIPGNLLGQEPVDPGRRHDLRQGPGVTEGIRQPGLFRVHAELVPEEALAFQELPRHGLGTGHIGVRFNPHAAHRDELARSDLFLDPAEQLRIEILDPFQLLRRGAGEHEVRVFVHQGDHVGKGARALADGFTDRPEPGGIDVRVAGRHQLVRRSVCGLRQYLGQLGPAGRCGACDVVGVQDVEHPFQRAQDFVPPRQLGGQLVHQSGERPDILAELPHFGVQLGELDPADPVDRVRAGGGFVAQGRRLELPVARDIRIRRCFDEEVDRAVRALQQLQRHVLVARRERLDDAAVAPPSNSFALEARHFIVIAEFDDDFGLAARAAEALGNRAGDVQPLGAPGRTPRFAFGNRGEILPDGFVERYRFSGDIPAGDGQGNGFAVAGRGDPFPDEPVQTRFSQPTIVVHGFSSFGQGFELFVSGFDLQSLAVRITAAKPCGG